MIVKQENKFISFIKKFWIYIVAGFLAIAISVTAGVMVAINQREDVVDVVKPGDGDTDGDGGDNTGGDGNDNSDNDNDNNNEDDDDDDKDDGDDDGNSGEVVNPDPIVFGLPMINASIIQDYSDTKLLYNPTLDRWEAHMCIDFTADDLSVYSVLDGEVISVEYDYLTGYVVKIEHIDGFVSTYGSLSESVTVKAGDKVSKGQKIGEASNLAGNSSAFGNHLQFTLLKDGEKIDPNNYLDLQEK